MIVLIDIGKKIKTLRQGRKLTQQEFADRLGITRPTISNYETGRRTPHLSELKRFAEFFGVDLNYFGINPADDIFQVSSRARDVFSNPDIPQEEKDRLYKEIMRMYLNI